VRESVYWRVVQGAADANVRFSDLRSLLAALGFVERMKGSHHIFTRPDVAEILNIQPRGSLAKPYQVKQVRNVILRYKLEEGTE
jgi:predicted RNA binding protein YcfA (HicA-like mRNA interferase family)